MCGRILDDEDTWLRKKWKTEVNVDSLLEATLPPGLVEDKVDTYEALVLAGRVSALSNEVPSLFDEEDSPPRVAEPLDACTPEQDTVVLVTPSKVAESLDAGISEEEDAIPGARKVTRHTPVNETKPLVVGDWLSDKGIIAWLNHKLYHNEIGDPRAWTTAVTDFVLCLSIMKKYEGSQGINHTIVVWLEGAATYLLLIVTIAKGSISLFVPWTAEFQYGPSKSGFGSHFLVLPGSGQC